MCFKTFRQSHWVHVVQWDCFILQPLKRYRVWFCRNIFWDFFAPLIAQRYQHTHIHDVPRFIASLYVSSFLPSLLLLTGKLCFYVLGTSVWRSYITPRSIYKHKNFNVYNNIFTISLVPRLSLLRGVKGYIVRIRSREEGEPGNKAIHYLYVHSIPVSISSFSTGSAFTTLRFSSVFKELCTILKEIL